jgi:hypothetical protein
MQQRPEHKRRQFRACVIDRSSVFSRPLASDPIQSTDIPQITPSRRPPSAIFTILPGFGVSSSELPAGSGSSSLVVVEAGGLRPSLSCTAS